MQELIIYHQKRHIYIWIILGLLLILLGIGTFFSNDNEFGFNLGIGLMYFSLGLYYAFRPYVRVKNNTLWVSTNPFGKINLNEIEQVKHFLDETTIISRGKETLISNQQMSDKDKKRFQVFLELLQENTKASVNA